MNKILTFCTLALAIFIVVLSFIKYNVYDGLSLAIVTAALLSIIVVFMQDANQDPETFSGFKNMV